MATQSEQDIVSQDIAGVTAGFQALPTPTASSVYGADNINAAVTSPTGAPNLNDPMGIYDFYTGGQDVKDAQLKAQQDAGALAKAQSTAEARQLAIEQQPLEGMNFILGEQSRAGQLDAQQISALARSAGVSQSAAAAILATAKEKAGIALDSRSELTQLITNNPGAGITYMDTPESAARKMETYNQEQIKIAEDKRAELLKQAEKKDKESAKDKQKQDLKDQAMALGLKTSGSRNELRKRIAKAAKEDKKKQDIIDDLKLQQARKSLSGSGGSGGTKSDLTTEGTSGLTSFFNSVRGQDGYVSPQDWAEAKSQWAQNGLTAASFNAIFGKWKNPNDKYQ